MLYLYGAGGHAKVIVEIAVLNGFVIQGLIDNNPDIQQLWDFPVSTEIPHSVYSGDGFVVSIGNNLLRKQSVSRVEEARDNPFFEILIHPKTAVSDRVELGEGTVVMAGASINPDTQIGKHVIVNTNASIDHDCVIGDFVHVSPNVALAGGVNVGEGTHIGIGACVIPGVRIGSWCTIGAGAVIIRDVPDGATVVGNPGRIVVG